MEGEPAFFSAGMLESSGRYRSQRASQLFARPPGVVRGELRKGGKKMEAEGGGG